MAGVWEEDLPSSEKLVLLAMADHADDGGKNCFPSIPRIAWKSSLTRRGVQKVLRRLEEKGRIRPTGRRANGTVEYTITLQWGERYSRGEHGSRRTMDTGGANHVRVEGEPGSPESSLTIIEPPKEKPPVVPLSGGQPKIEYVQWGGELIEVEMGNRKRLVNERERQALSGGRAESMLALLQQKGFRCRIVPKEHKATA